MLLSEALVILNDIYEEYGDGPLLADLEYHDNYFDVTEILPGAWSELRHQDNCTLIEIEEYLGE